MSAITIDHDLVHYEVLGRGRPVIFVHGWLGSWRYWVPAMQQLSTKFRVYALDLWGFGESAKDVRRYGFASQVLLLNQFMDEMGITKAALVGHNLGAAIAVHYAVRYPDRVPRLMAVCPPLFSMESGVIDVLPPVQPAAVATEDALPQRSEDVRAWVDVTLEQRARELGETLLRAQMFEDAIRFPLSRRPLPPPGLDGANTVPDLPILHAFEGENPVKRHLGDLDPMALLEKHVTPGPDLTKLKAESMRADPRVLPVNLESLAGVDTLGALKALTMPVVALFGADDSLLPAPDGKALTTLRGNRRPFHAMSLANARHFPMLENIAGFNRLLLDFLEVPDVTKLQIKKQWERRVR